MRRDYYAERMLRDRDIRAKIFFAVWIASICATASLFIGGVYMFYLGMRYFGWI